MLSATPADRRLLPEGRFAGPMPWVIAIMMFLTVLATATGLAMGRAGDQLGENLGRKLTVQVTIADRAQREAQAAAAERVLKSQEGVVSVSRVGDAEMQSLLKPWLGDTGLDRDLPIPAMIDVELSNNGRDRIADIKAAVSAAAPAAKIDDHAGWLGPLLGLIRSLTWLAGGIVALMVAATAAAVVLAARASLNTHQSTIDVLHMMGATDVQVARLFQRRIALDALFGAVIGLVAAIVVVAILGHRVMQIGSGLIGSISLSWGSWFVMLILPLLAGALALFVARVTVVRALRTML